MNAQRDNHGRTQPSQAKNNNAANVTPQNKTRDDIVGDIREENNSKKKAKDCIEWEMEKFIRDHIFPKMKFITNDNTLAYSSSKNSVCQKILSGVNCDIDNEQAFWNNYKGSIFNMMKICRSNTTASMKTGFGGTLTEINIL